MSSWDEIIASILEPVLQLDPRIDAGIEGCTDEDVARIEHERGVSLPAAFVALVRRIGRHRGHLFRGEDFGYPELLRFRESAEHAVTDTDLILDPLDFVFLMHQGYQFHFFRTDAGDDPPVFLCDPDEDWRIVDLGLSFTGWLRVCMNEELQLWKSALVWEASEPGRNLFREQPQPVSIPWWKLW